MTRLKKIKFKEFITLQRGFDLPKKDMCEGDIPVVGSTSIIGYHNSFKALPPGVITGRSGSLGTVQYITTKYWPHNTSLWTKDFKGNNPRYVYYILKTIDFNNFNAGVGVPTLNRNHLDNYELQIHEFSEQLIVSSILGNYDDLIDNNTRRIRLLEKMAKLIYDEWFIKFKFPGHEKVKTVDSELGKIPEGWEVKKVGDLVLLEYGDALPAKKRTQGSHPVYGSSGIIGYHNSYMVKGPGIVIGRAGNAGDVHWADVDFFPVDSSFYIKLKDTNLNLFYVYYLFKNLNLKNLIAGSAVPGINRNAIYLLECVQPPNSVLNRFYEVISPIFEELFLLRKKNKILSETRDLLLPRLISGEIDVSELDIKVPEVEA